MKSKSNDDAAAQATGLDHAEGDPPTNSVDTDGLLRKLAASLVACHNELAPGTMVGRSFRIVRKLGAGGMGKVYLARDAQLERDLAVKLHATGSEGKAKRGMLREAQAMAKLSHPNVVTVHEVGTHDDELFIAMEYVPGRTAAEWLATKPDVDEVLSTFAAAGRGLVAAHDAGLIHRDFKPTNILIGDDGQVKVADFGLAQVDPVQHSLDPQAVEMAPLTVTGAIMGTPAYMAPEQRKGRKVDARADQFGFSLVLYEALCGELPTLDDDGGITAAALEHSAIPDELRAALARGLAVDPEDRFPDLGALLEAIRPRPPVPTAPRRWRAIAIASAIATTAAIAVTAMMLRSDSSQCHDGTQKLEAVWNDRRRASLLEAFGGRAWVVESGKRVAGLLDRYAMAWKEEHQASCEATRQGSQTAQVLDRRATCLHRSLRRLEQTITVLTRDGTKAAEKAVASVHSLPPPEQCGDIEHLVAEVSPPTDPATRLQVEEIRDQLAESLALGRSAAFAEAAELSTQAVDAARAIDYPPIQAEALEVLGRIQLKRGDAESATASFEEAYFLARSCGHDRLAAKAASSLVSTYGSFAGDVEAGKRWADHALADAARAGEGTAVEAYAKHEVGLLYTTLRQPAKAEQLLRRALELYRKEDKPLEIARALYAVGVVEELKGNPDAAMAAHQEVLEIVIAEQGPTHPRVIHPLNGLAKTEWTRGNFEAALKYYQRAHELARSSLGPDHPQTVGALESSALCFSELGQNHNAISVLERVLAIAAKRGTTNYEYARVLMNLGTMTIRAGQSAQASQHLDQAIAAFEAALGEDSPWLAQALTNRAEVDFVAGKIGEALPQLRRADRILADAMPDHPMRGQTLWLLANALAERGFSAEAAKVAEHALVLEFEKPPVMIDKLKALAGR